MSDVHHEWVDRMSSWVTGSGPPILTDPKKTLSESMEELQARIEAGGSALRSPPPTKTVSQMSAGMEKGFVSFMDGLKDDLSKELVRKMEEISTQDRAAQGDLMDKLFEYIDRESEKVRDLEATLLYGRGKQIERSEPSKESESPKRRSAFTEKAQNDLLPILDSIEKTILDVPGDVNKPEPPLIQTSDIVSHPKVSRIYPVQQVPPSGYQQGYSNRGSYRGVLDSIQQSKEAFDIGIRTSSSSAVSSNSDYAPSHGGYHFQQRRSSNASSLGPGGRRLPRDPHSFSDQFSYNSYPYNSGYGAPPPQPPPPPPPPPPPLGGVPNVPFTKTIAVHYPPPPPFVPSPPELEVSDYYEGPNWEVEETQMTYVFIIIQKKTKRKQRDSNLQHNYNTHH